MARCFRAPAHRRTARRCMEDAGVLLRLRRVLLLVPPPPARMAVPVGAAQAPPLRRSAECHDDVSPPLAGGRAARASHRAADVDGVRSQARERRSRGVHRRSVARVHPRQPAPLARAALPGGGRTATAPHPPFARAAPSRSQLCGVLPALGRAVRQLLRTRARRISAHGSRVRRARNVDRAGVVAAVRDVVRSSRTEAACDCAPNRDRSVRGFRSAKTTPVGGLGVRCVCAGRLPARARACRAHRLSAAGNRQLQPNRVRADDDHPVDAWQALPDERDARVVFGPRTMRAPTCTSISTAFATAPGTWGRNRRAASSSSATASSKDSWRRTRRRSRQCSPGGRKRMDNGCRSTTSASAAPI